MAQLYLRPSTSICKSQIIKMIHQPRNIRETLKNREKSNLNRFTCLPSGLRPSHLKDCVKKAGSTLQLRIGLLAFIQAALSGALPRQAQQVICASTLVPLLKKDGSIRPIAVGDTLRRLAGKVLLSIPEVRDET